VFLAALRHLSIKALALALLEAFGALWLIVEISAHFSPAFSSGVKPYWWVFLVIGVTTGLIRAWPRLAETASISGTDCSITIRVCDMFKVADAVLVVGTNTTFDTAIEDGTIDKASVQGQLTTKLFSTVGQLDLEIADSLKGIPCAPIPADKKPYGKQNLYDHSIRIPLVISGPGIPKGRAAEGLCYLMDVCPTILEMAGISAPANIAGKSLGPMLRDQHSRIRDEVIFAYRHFQRGISTGRWKLIEYNVGGNKTSQLFDLRKDPLEKENLAAQPSHAETAGRLHALLQQRLRESGDRTELAAATWPEFDR